MHGVPRERPKDEPFPPPAAEPAIELSEEQKNILKMVKSGRNIFFTGAAGDATFETVYEDQRIHHHLQAQESRYSSEP